MMRVLMLNLPNSERIMRRYMCSYHSPTFLYPPTELICLAAISRDLKGHQVRLLDAIAEGKNRSEVLEEIRKFQPDLIVSITGFECVEQDAEEVAAIRHSYPSARYVLFGHYATLFCKEMLQKTGVDYVILGEPDLVYAELCEVLAGKTSIESVSGIAYHAPSGLPVVQGEGSRIPNPNQLPMPAYDLLKIEAYSEPFMPQPFGLIQTARGCPYKCNYCVKSFGTKLTTLSPELILEHIQFLINRFGIKSLRFIDDTFTATPARVIQLCKLMIEHNIQLKWSCLSRADTLNHEMLKWMRKAGCVRLFIGMESGSQRILDYYSKGIRVEEALQELQFARSLGFELMGWFMVGAPEETEEDLANSIAFANRAGFDFISVSEIQPYPGTLLFEQLRNEIDFSIFPYQNRLKNEEMEWRKKRWTKKFYRSFYIHPGFIFRLLKKKFWVGPGEIITNTGMFFNYLFGNRSNKVRSDLM